VWRKQLDSAVSRCRRGIFCSERVKWAELVLAACLVGGIDSIDIVATANGKGDARSIAKPELSG